MISMYITSQQWREAIIGDDSTGWNSNATGDDSTGWNSNVTTDKIYISLSYDWYKLLCCVT